MSDFFKGLKNASYLALGNIATQIVSFLGFIYIARILGPNDYGIYVTVGTFVGMFQIISLNGLNKVVIREGSKNISSMYMYLEKTIGVKNLLVTASIIICIICSFFTSYAFQTKLYIIIFSSSLFYQSLNGVLGTIYQATEKMKYISIFGIVDRIMFVSLSIAFLHHGFGLLSLFLIALFSHFSTLLVNYNFSKKIINFRFLSKVQFDSNLLRPAIVFSIFTFVTFFTTSIDLLMISFLGTPQDVGRYGVAYKIANQGIMLRNVTATAFFPIFVKSFHNSKMQGNELLKYSSILLAGMLSLVFILSFFCELVVNILFGSEYKGSGEILRVLIFWLAIYWATLPFTIAAQATYNEKLMLFVTSCMAVLNILLNYIFYLWFGLIGVAYSTLVVFSIGGLWMCGLIYRRMARQNYLV